MSIDNEFATVDAILASTGETRGVDAFALALIKAERQIRKLFTYLVYQSDAFNSSDVDALRNALANRRLYFRDFVLGWEKLYSRPLKDIVGKDCERLYTVIEEAIQIRNKIFHGQLTTKYLSREELIGFVEQIRSWCHAVAVGSDAEIGYDGFGRNSFRKSRLPLSGRLVAKLGGIENYSQLLADMEKRPKNDLGAEGGSTQVRSQAVHTTAQIRRTDFREVLVRRFPEWVSYFESNGPFRRPGQLEYHREAIGRRIELGSAAAAVTDDLFLHALYKTLRAWGIGLRRSRLKSFDEFAGVFGRQKQAVAQLEMQTLDDPLLDVDETIENAWALLSQLAIVENTATLVPATKALHHVLPELIVPMDREYTQVFFGWQNPQFQYGQRKCFSQAFTAFAEIARVVKPTQYVNSGWNTSRTKVIDNALVGLLRWIKDHPTSGSR